MVNLREDMCKFPNDYFLSVFTKEDKSIVPVCEQKSREEESEKLIDVEVARELMVRKIDKMKKFKSPGPDEIYPRLIEVCKEVVSQPLVNIFRKSVETSELSSNF